MIQTFAGDTETPSDDDASAQPPAEVAVGEEPAAARDPSENADLVLIIEDEPSLVSAIAYNLTKSGFRVITASDGAEGLERAQLEYPDLVLLDVMLPKVDGFEVCRRIRASSEVPIVILSAKTEEMDRVIGLELGADDYVTKPFSMNELIARIRTRLRRSNAHHISPQKSRLVVRDLVIDAQGRTVHRGTRELLLKHREFDLLYFLAQHTNQVFTREQLVERVWGYEFFGGGRTVDVHVRWLREKIEEDPAHPEYLVTVRGVGYKFLR